MRIPLSLAAMLLLAACSTLPSAPPALDARGVEIARIASSLVGTPYQFGGADTQGFDCSGLAFYAHQGVGLTIPRTAAAQSRAAQPVAVRALRPGDLLFFRMGRRRVDHVGVYTGHGRFVHAPRRGEVVAYASLEDPYFRKRLVRAGRFWAHP